MSSWCTVASTSDVARAAAEDMALSGGTALSCVLSGYFAAAGASAGVLLSPLSLLVVGYGAARAFDGRARQPGVQGKRPRGYLREAEAPAAARVAVPAATVAALVAVGYERERRMAAIMKAGLAHAKRVGATARERVLRRIGELGAGAFADPGLHRPLIHVAGPSEGGVLTSGDFTEVIEVDYPASRYEGLLRCPWAGERDQREEGQELLAAIDVHGSAAIACFGDASTGVMVDELELLAPQLATPVLRGVPRLRPGVPLPASAPIELVVDASGRVLLARESGAEPPTFALAPPARA